jgi:hypothetical protein
MINTFSPPFTAIVLPSVPMNVQRMKTALRIFDTQTISRRAR